MLRTLSLTLTLSRYYQHKLGVGLADDEKRREVAAEYVKGLCWVLRYYYGTNEGKALPNAGVPSWTWYYPSTTLVLGLGVGLGLRLAFP